MTTAIFMAAAWTSIILAKRAPRRLRFPTILRNVQKPVLGYFGVVDERMDYELIAKLADANPNWTVVIIGPRTKVDRSRLPQRPIFIGSAGAITANCPITTKASMFA